MVKKHRIYIKLLIDLFQVENGNYKNSCINSWRVAGCHYPTTTIDIWKNISLMCLSAYALLATGMILGNISPTVNASSTRYILVVE
jgi:hypothetical protein